MVREIIHVQVGQCGNQIGNAFWKIMGKEHKLSASGKFQGKPEEGDNQARLDKIDVYYQEAGTMRFVPRACLVDLEPGIMDVIKASPMRKLLKHDNMVFGANGAGNNWAKGHYTEGAEIVDQAVDMIRGETEKCDCPQGFQLVHSLGGGTGSGMGTLLLLKIRDIYPDRINATFSVYPSSKVSDVVVEPYNATLSTCQLLENADKTFVIDNAALYNIDVNVLKQKNPSYEDYNWLAAMTMCGATAPLRFSSELNCDLRKMCTNLVPFPRLHFILMSQAPLFAEPQDEESEIHLKVEELTKQIWSSRNSLANIEPKDGKCLSVSVGFRGPEDIDILFVKIQGNKDAKFAEYVPNNIKIGNVCVPLEGTTESATIIANTTALKGIFQRLSTQFGAIYKRKAFLHWYKGEGMDEMEFQEADKNVRDLITEYQDKQDVVYEEDEDDEEDEDN